MAIFDDVKSSLGITHGKKNDEIMSTISAAKIKMKMQGVNKIVESDPLTAQAIKLYAKAEFNFQGDGERYAKAFSSLTDAMALSDEYDGFKNNDSGHLGDVWK